MLSGIKKNISIILFVHIYLFIFIPSREKNLKQWHCGKTNQINEHIIPISPDLLNLPHLGPGPSGGEGEGAEGGGEDDDERPHEHVGSGAVHSAQGGRRCLL